jgi:hypothetical protein
MMAEESELRTALTERIRADSASIGLTPASSFQDLVPDVGEAVRVLEESAGEDIRMMTGSTERYYFSDRSMTPAYARYLYRVAERDAERLIAETTRDESKTYPRPTLLETFMEPPFSLSQTELDEAVLSMLAKPEYADIQCTEASNGARFLYSTNYLGAVHAESLAEWIEVGQKENP